MRHYFISLLLAIIVLSNTSKVLAESSYVLPYPSAMPGSFFYKLNLIQEEFLKYWYFGDIGQYKYNLNQADKYLVEAKTLFDYKQYLLGSQALNKSDFYYKKISPHLVSLRNRNINIDQKKEELLSASQKHIEELEEIKGTVPKTFEWTPEKSRSTTLFIHQEISDAIEIRKFIL